MTELDQLKDEVERLNRANNALAAEVLMKGATTTTFSQAFEHVSNLMRDPGCNAKPETPAERYLQLQLHAVMMMVSLSGDIGDEARSRLQEQLNDTLELFKRINDIRVAVRQEHLH